MKFSLLFIYVIFVSNSRHLYKHRGLSCLVIQCQSLQGRIPTHDFLMADDYNIIYEKRIEGI